MKQTLTPNTFDNTMNEFTLSWAAQCQTTAAYYAHKARMIMLDDYLSEYELKDAMEQARINQEQSAKWYSKVYNIMGMFD